MHVRFTDDLTLVKLILTHPDNWPSLANDDVPEEWEMPADWLYLVALDPDPCGVFALHVIDGETIGLHVAILKPYRGKGTLEAGMGALGMIWAHTPAQRVLVRFEEWNKKARAAAVRSGFREVGRIPGAVRRGGELVDFIEMELRRP